MKKIKQQPQLELFSFRGNVHALGLLRWDDALWTQPLEIKLLSGETLHTNLITIRRLHAATLSPTAQTTPPRNEKIPDVEK